MTALFEGEARFGPWVLVGGEIGRGSRGAVTAVVHARTLERGGLERFGERRAETRAAGDAEKARARFLRELEVVGSLRHPFIVPILDAGLEPEPYVVTRIAPFGALDRAYDAFRGDASRSLRLVRAVAQALAVTHAQRIAHRDLQPGNVLLEALDHPLLTGFGIAQLEGRGAPPDDGVQAYAPPEWADGAATRATFDVFSLGGVLHSAMVGATATTAYRARDGRVETVGDLRIDALIAKLLEPEPARRPPTMVEVVALVDAELAALREPRPRPPDACDCGGAFVRLPPLLENDGPHLLFKAEGVPSILDFGVSLERCHACGVLRGRMASAPR